MYSFLKVSDVKVNTLLLFFCCCCFLLLLLTVAYRMHLNLGLRTYPHKNIKFISGTQFKYWD